MKGLTKRQKEILDYIEQFIKKNRYSPSYREIQNSFGFSSLGSVAKHISVLKRKGVLVAEKKASRSIYPIVENPPENEHVSSEIELPFLGHISAGSPIETFAQTQTLAVPDFLVPTADTTYALRARGSSLHDEMIADGDIILVEARHEAHAEETIVGMINHEETVVRQYFPEGTFIRLSSLNPLVKPLVIRHEDLLVQGVVVGLLRLF